MHPPPRALVIVGRKAKEDSRINWRVSGVCWQDLLPLPEPWGIVVKAQEDFGRSSCEAAGTSSSHKDARCLRGVACPKQCAR